MTFYFKKVGFEILTLSLIFSFLLPISTVSAQGGVASGGISAAVGCGGGEYLKEKLGGALESLGLGDLLSGGEMNEAWSTATVTENYAVQTGGGGNKVPVEESTLQDISEDILDTDRDILGDTGKIKDNTRTIKDRENEQKTKEFTLDCVARELARVVIREMTDSLVEWINNGFEGSPLFLEDPMAFFQSIEDSVTGALIRELGLTPLCSLSADALRLAIGLDFGARRGVRERYACTLRDIEMNVGDIFDDLSSRGLQDFLDLSLNPNDNVWGAYLGLNDEANRIIADVTGNQKTQLGWNSGFFSQIDGDGKIITPGKLIEDNLANMLGSEVRQLELADEFNEIAKALVDALINKVMSAAGGLRN
jgi:hypothetical protein